MSCPSRPVLTQSVSAIPVTSNSSSSIPTVPCRRQAAECGETIQIVVAGDCLWSCSRGIWRHLPVLFGGGKQLYAVLVKRLQTEHPELPLYKNLPALWPGLVLRRTAWGMSHQVAVRRDQAALGCCKNRAPTQERTMCLCVQGRSVSSEGMLLLSNDSLKAKWEHFLILMSGCTWNTISPFPAVFDNLAQLCSFSARSPGNNTNNNKKKHFLTLFFDPVLQQ